MNNEIYTSGFFCFGLMFCLGGALAVFADLDFDLDGFDPDGGGEVGGAFGQVQWVIDGVRFTVKLTVNPLQLLLMCKLL